MPNESENGVPLRAQQAAESFGVLIARVMASENLDLHNCMAADLNAFLMSLALLSRRKAVVPSDIPLLFERFRLTLQAMPPSSRGQSDYVPHGRPQNDRANAEGTSAVDRVMRIGS